MQYKESLVKLIEASKLNTKELGEELDLSIKEFNDAVIALSSGRIYLQTVTEIRTTEIIVKLFLVASNDVQQFIMESATRLAQLSQGKIRVPLPSTWSACFFMVTTNVTDKWPSNKKIGNDVKEALEEQFSHPCSQLPLVFSRMSDEIEATMQSIGSHQPKISRPDGGTFQHPRKH